MKAKIWSEVTDGPSWAGRGVRYWHYQARRGNVSIRGICLTWPAALIAVRSHLGAK